MTDVSSGCGPVTTPTVCTGDCLRAAGEDPVDAVIAAFLDHLEHGGPAPSLDHLTGDERTEAAELIDLIKDARGVDFYRSRPSLDAVLHGTETDMTPWSGK